MQSQYRSQPVPADGRTELGFNIPVTFSDPTYNVDSLYVYMGTRRPDRTGLDWPQASKLIYSTIAHQHRLRQPANTLQVTVKIPNIIIHTDCLLLRE